MLADIAGVSPAKPPVESPDGRSATRDAIRDAVGMRHARLDLYLVTDAEAEASELLPAGRWPREALAHAAVRRACIAWADRSLSTLKAAMRGDAGPGLEARLAHAVEDARRDDGRLRGIIASGAQPAPSDLASMSTNGPLP